MSDDPFLAAILADPLSDEPRLVYADWLEERGDPHGQFIRLQCALAQLGPRPRVFEEEQDWHPLYDNAWSVEVREADGGQAPPTVGEIISVRRLNLTRLPGKFVHNLLVEKVVGRRDYYHYWRLRLRRYGSSKPYPARKAQALHKQAVALLERHHEEWWPTNPAKLAGPCAWHWRRGFVEGVQCTVQAWRQDGAAVRAVQPVLDVYLDDYDGRSFPPTGAIMSAPGVPALAGLRSVTVPDRVPYDDADELARQISQKYYVTCYRLTDSPWWPEPRAFAPAAAPALA